MISDAMAHAKFEDYSFYDLKRGDEIILTGSLKYFQMQPKELKQSNKFIWVCSQSI